MLRIRADGSSPPAEFEALIGETPLGSTRVDGELFPPPPEDPVITDRDRRSDFVVPIELLRKGWNAVTVRLVSTPMVTIERVELALYHEVTIGSRT